MSMSEIVARPPGPRNLRAIDSSRLIFSIDSRLWMFHGADLSEIQTSGQSDIVGIVPSQNQLLLVRHDGAVSSLDSGSGKVSEISSHMIRVAPREPSPGWEGIACYSPRRKAP